MSAACIKTPTRISRNCGGLTAPENRHEPDYAAKIHIVSAPVYYHDYMLGSLFASQVHHYIATQVLGAADARTTSFYGDKRAGDFLVKNIFAPGATYYWNDMLRRATGEELDPKYFAADFIGE